MRDRKEIYGAHLEHSLETGMYRIGHSFDLKALKSRNPILQYPYSANSFLFLSDQRASIGLHRLNSVLRCSSWLLRDMYISIPVCTSFWPLFGHSLGGIIWNNTHDYLSELLRVSADTIGGVWGGHVFLKYPCVRVSVGYANSYVRRASSYHSVTGVSVG